EPMCLVFTELPPGLAVAEQVDRPISFDGYFFKRYRYKAGDTWRDAPLLIGRTVVLGQPAQPQEEERSVGDDYLYSIAGLFAAALFLGIGLTWWYRRGDQQVQSRLAESRNVEFVEPEAGGSSPDGEGEAF